MKISCFLSWERRGFFYIKRILLWLLHFQIYSGLCTASESLNSKPNVNVISIKVSHGSCNHGWAAWIFWGKIILIVKERICPRCLKTQTFVVTPAADNYMHRLLQNWTRKAFCYNSGFFVFKFLNGGNAGQMRTRNWKTIASIASSQFHRWITILLNKVGPRNLTSFDIMEKNQNMKLGKLLVT